MTTSSGHTSAILASKVKGTAVYNEIGDRIGTVEDVVLDKQTNQILFAALGFGGVLGLGEKYYPVPWSMLDYDDDKGGYVVPLDKDALKSAPARSGGWPLQCGDRAGQVLSPERGADECPLWVRTGPWADQGRMSAFGAKQTKTITVEQPA